MSSIKFLSHASRTLTRRYFLRSVIGLPFATSALKTLSFARGQSSSSEPTSTRDRLNYHPEGLYVWDIWFFTRGDEVHLLHLQKKRPGSTRPEEYDGAIGHAVSTDLLSWKELPPALFRGSEGSLDDLDLFTGCAIAHEENFYLFYTARMRREKGIYQRICLATSDDAIHWEKYPQPVIEPDPRWYTKEDCRDLIIQKHPETGEFHGFYAAGVPKTELVERNVIAHVRSRDLIHWTHEPPVFLPVGQAVVECPDVFFLNGRWWMTCNAGHHYGARAGFSDPYVTWGTIYASAERIEGPYRQGEDNVLIGSMEFNGFCCRSAVWKGRRYLFYGQGERIDGRDRGKPTTGTITTPKELLVSPQGNLQPVYSPLIEQRAERELIAQPTSSELIEIGGRFGTPGEWNAGAKQILATSPKSWSVRICGPDAESFIFTADLSLQSGRGIGLLFRQSLAVFLDNQEQALVFTHLTQLQRLDCRRIHVEHGHPYRMRVVAKEEFFEVYLDDQLILNFVRYEPPRGRFGFYVEAGEGTFSNVRAMDLK
jgi:beta-fructofuranosidase